MDFNETQNAESKAEEQTKTSGQSYNYSDQELIKRLVKSRMEQKQQLEYEDLDGYVLPPPTQFSMLKKPAVTIKYGKMTFNMASIRLFESVKYILPLVHPTKKKLTIVTCAEEESASVQWARFREKDGQWVNRAITSEEFIHNIFTMMGWNLSCRYKVLGHVSNSKEGLVLVFELEEAVMYDSKPLEIVDKETGEIKKKQVKYYPDAYKDVIGKSYNDYVESRQMNMFEYLEDYLGQTYDDKPNENPSDSENDEQTANEQLSFQNGSALSQQESKGMNPQLDGGGNYDGARDYNRGY